MAAVDFTLPTRNLYASFTPKFVTFGVEEARIGLGGASVPVRVRVYSYPPMTRR